MNHIALSDFDASTLRGGMELNIVIGLGDPEMVELMFQPEGKEIFIQTTRDITWPQLLAVLGCFPSTSQARKNWCQGQKKKAEIEYGFHQITVGKARRLFLHVYKPFREYETQKV